MLFCMIYFLLIEGWLYRGLVLYFVRSTVADTILFSLTKIGCKLFYSRCRSNQKYVGNTVTPSICRIRCIPFCLEAIQHDNTSLLMADGLVTFKLKATTYEDTFMEREGTRNPLCINETHFQSIRYSIHGLIL